jgi:hypothetical protein
MADEREDAPVSIAGPGEVATAGDDVKQVTVSDINDEPMGVLEQWAEDAWIFARVEDLQETEPAHD